MASALAYGVFWALILESVTIFSRFGLRLESQQDTAFLAPITFGLRIHHGYVGGLMLVASALASRRLLTRSLIVGGVALVLSDVIHHFVVLWPITGSPEFYLTY